MPDKWFFIVNSTAGNGKTGKKINTLINLLNQHNFDFQIELTRYTKHAIELAQVACLEGFKNIIAVGGDGTVSEVAAGIARSGLADQVNFSVIPEGGGNDFCKNFHLSHNIEKCLTQLINGKLMKIDIAAFEDQFFVNSFGIGFDAQTAAQANKIKFLNGLPRYLLAIAAALLKYRNFPLKIIIDDKEVLSGKFLLVAIGNGKYAGGGFKLNPNALVNDDFLDVMLARDVTLMRIFKVLPKAIEGTHEAEPEVSFHRCRKIEIISECDLPVYYDGEIPQLKNCKHLTIQIAPQKLNFIAPR
ncbi:MAG: diacylglycerol kinase family lipid kinase [Candidatus Cloacimonetes bacterium]|nr:diacylglycerol kinase family lipid kinase [Candidatus Cloacimonadota bacterium]